MSSCGTRVLSGVSSFPSGFSFLSGTSSPPAWFPPPLSSIFPRSLLLAEASGRGSRRRKRGGGSSAFDAAAFASGDNLSCGFTRRKSPRLLEDVSEPLELLRWTSPALVTTTRPLAGSTSVLVTLNPFIGSTSSVFVTLNPPKSPVFVTLKSMGVLRPSRPASYRSATLISAGNGSLGPPYFAGIAVLPSPPFLLPFASPITSFSCAPGLVLSSVWEAVDFDLSGV